MGYQHRVHGECAIGHCILLSKSTPFDLRSSKMKYFALLMVVGLAAASSTGLGRELKFDAGKEYLFQYSGRLMSGIPELANQYSGLAINATVGLIAKSQTTLSLVVSAPKFVKINDVLNSEETVPGKCLATYQANQLPEYMVKENPMLIPHPEACPEKKFYEVIRTVDFTNCEKSSTFSFIRPGHFFQGQQSEIIS